jgi:hypothetical protein
MSALRELQRAFRRALLEEDEAAIAALTLSDGLAPGERLAVYRNNLVASLTAALKDVFPATCRLVDERFFAYAAHEFLCAHPPAEACLAHYGAGLPDFLAGFPPSAPLPYLADVARLEWLMHRAAEAPEGKALDAQAMAAIPAADTPRLCFTLQPTLGHIASPWPIELILRANRPEGRDAEETGAEKDREPIDLDAGGVRLEVTRRGETVTLRALEAPSFAFRQVLAAGTPLEAAADAALAHDGGFDLAAALSSLFRGGLVVGVGLAPL